MKDNDTDYKISIKGPGVSIDKTTSNPNVAASIFSLLMSPTLHTQKEGFLQEIGPAKTEKAVREYLNEKSPKTNSQKITVFAMFLRDYLDFKTITQKDLKSQFEKSHEPVPANFSRDFMKAISLGWLAESYEQPGKFFITLSGEGAVNGSFKSEIKRSLATKNRKSGKRPKGTLVAATIRDEIKKIELIPNPEGYKSYWDDLTTKSDRALWLLAQAKEKGIEKLNSKELSTLASKVNDNIVPKQIKSLLLSHSKKGLVSQSVTDGLLRLTILEGGIRHVQKIAEDLGDDN
ncbi:hypothetical protein KKH23_00310 [Patescibacteria group bacterium]|nr:hypothetical protein [Patescibacteria group bacterium]MBU0776790.1 hypothetical protein [Patescibacteria group bacterium]MBU0845635.1 hypothetical protein [Patescibacteria group bacterium]MBU0922677.1 hypothetical protein [Patescibacteria group bacterium]MBU1066728.1 hypothetical protein [Patescibacteria group bacterium]